MSKAGNSNKYAIIAAICYAVYGTFQIYKSAAYAVRWSDYVTITILGDNFWIVTIGMAVTLLLKNEKAVLAAAGANALVFAYYTFRRFGLNMFYCLSAGAEFLSYIALAIILVLALKGNVVIKRIWFYSAATMLLGYWIRWCCVEYFFSRSASQWLYRLFSVVEVVGLAFAGLWLKDKIAPEPNSLVNEYASFNPQTVVLSSVMTNEVGGADKLVMYKELLESGVITQAEFDAKKKLILGL